MAGRSRREETEVLKLVGADRMTVLLRTSIAIAVPTAGVVGSATLLFAVSIRRLVAMVVPFEATEGVSGVPILGTGFLVFSVSVLITLGLSQLATKRAKR